MPTYQEVYLFILYVFHKLSIVATPKGQRRNPWTDYACEVSSAQYVYLWVWAMQQFGTYEYDVYNNYGKEDYGDGYHSPQHRAGKYDHAEDQNGG